MKVTLQLPDEICESYQRFGRPGQELAEILQAQLLRFASCDPKIRLLFVPHEQLKQLETLTTKIPLTTPDDLVRRVANLAEVSIGGIRFKWTASQYRDLQEKAKRWRITPAEYAERVVREIESLFFSYNPRESKEPILEKAPADASQP